MSIELSRLLSKEVIKTSLKRLNDILRMKRVSFDIDGVLVANNEIGVGVVNREFGTSFRIEDIKTDFGIVGLLKGVPQVTDPLEEAIKIWNSEEVLKRSNPVSGAWMLSRYLVDQGVIPFTITSRPATTTEVTRSWFGQWMPWLPPENICIQTDGNQISLDFK
ncbi:MAG: hypothetical protein AAB685_02105, partial [Patescibacteria group bacterium]